MHARRTLERVARQHVGYELEMMAVLAVARFPVGSESFLGNGLLEAYLLHVRNLNEFLGREAAVVRRKGWEQTVVAAHYFGGSYPSRFALGKPARDRLNRKLAHITAARRRDTRWDVDGRTTWWAERILWNFEHRFLSRLRRVDAAAAGWFDDGFSRAVASLTESSGGGVIVARVAPAPEGWRLVVPSLGRGDDCTDRAAGP